MAGRPLCFDSMRSSVLDAFGTVKHHPRAEVVTELLEPMRYAGGHKQHIARYKRTVLAAVEKDPAALRRRVPEQRCPAPAAEVTLLIVVFCRVMECVNQLLEVRSSDGLGVNATLTGRFVRRA